MLHIVRLTHDQLELLLLILEVVEGFPSDGMHERVRDLRQHIEKEASFG